MQTAKLNLKEIIWEVTGECHNGCKYCGSKDQWKIETNTGIIRKILDKICEYPPEQIDISGGDPLILPINLHQEIVTKLKTAGTKMVKILVNPKSIIKKVENNIINVGTEGQLQILQLYDWIGLSINTEEELELGEKLTKTWFKNVTIITNFNTTNLYMFDYIKEYVKKNKLAWQIQFTMSDNLGWNIYESDLATKAFFDQVRKAIDEGVKVIPADNMNGGDCSAGINSLGILADGDVIPCLSMRSWIDDITEVVQGNILEFSTENTLKDIWEVEFKKQRFGNFYCCKDDCKHKCFSYFEPKKSITERFKESDTCPPPKDWLPVPPGKEIPMDAQLYAVQPNPWNPGGTVIYGVGGIPQVMAYAVFPDNSMKMLYGAFRDSGMYPVYGVSFKKDESINCMYLVATGDTIPNNTLLSTTPAGYIVFWMERETKE